MTEDEKNTKQPKVNTWMRKREQDCIALGWKRIDKTGSAAIISPRLCEKLKEAQEKAEEAREGEKNKAGAVPEKKGGVKGNDRG